MVHTSSSLSVYEYSTALLDIVSNLPLALGVNDSKKSININACTNTCRRNAKSLTCSQLDLVLSFYGDSVQLPQARRDLYW